VSKRRNIMQKKIWIVFKTHFDIGYNDTVEDVLRKYRGPMIENALSVIEENRSQAADKRFTWTLAGWPLSRIIDKKQTQAKCRRIIAALKEGSLAVHALPFTMHTDSMEMEELVRGLGFSSRIARKLGQPLPIAAKMTDVPCHSWFLPVLLAHAGIRFLHLGDNPACQYPRLPPIFRWEGPDGSRILCVYTTHYGSPSTPPEEWPCKNYLAMNMTGDNHGPPNEQEIEKLLEEIAAKEPDAQVVFGSLDDFALAIEAENPDLPVVRGDMPDLWIHGVLSNPEESATARNIRPLQSALETLDTQLRNWKLKPGHLGAKLAESYENSLLYGEHTWGFYSEAVGYHFGDEWRKLLAKGHYARGRKIVTGQKVNWLKTFEDHRDYIRKTESIVSCELRKRLGIIAKSVKAEGPRTIVYNPLPWPRSGLVGIPGQADSLLFAEDIPANGYRTFKLEKAVRPRESHSNTLETPFYNVSFDLRRGGISSLIEKKTGREIADRSSPYALGQFLHERFSKNEIDAYTNSYIRIPAQWAWDEIGKPNMPDPKKSPYAALTPASWKICVRNTEHADIATLTTVKTKNLADSYAITFTFNNHEASVEVKWTVDGKVPNPMPEGGWLCFPFNVEEPQFSLGRPGGPVDPASDIIPGSNRHLYAVATGVSISGSDKKGFSLCPIDSPLVSLDQPGLWKWDMDFIPKLPTVFVNLYNNMWNTNFRLWQDGSWNCRVRMWPDTALCVPSWEARLPLLAAYADGKSGTMPEIQSGLSISRSGSLVTAYGKNPDGAGTLLRIWEQSGFSGELIVGFPRGAKFAKAVPVSLRGEKTGKPIDIAVGELKFKIRAYAPASFILN
jgi:alpha-mannosidase